MKSLVSILVVSALVTGFSSCAKYGVPGGGPDDDVVPTIIWAESDDNFQINFNGKSIRLTFDEWINLSNPSKEIVISPPLIKPLSASIRGKSVLVEFAEDEILKPDVTYQINFGDAIRDFTAGNILKNCIYVFSTGDKIDSLSIGGIVTDELTKKPVADALVMLYANMSDSVLLNQKPFYFSKTGKDGSFNLNNLRSDSFQIYALLDENVSYTYDLPGEKIAYYDRLIYTSDTINSNIQLSLFDEEDPPRLVDSRHDVHGLLKVKYENQPRAYTVEPLTGSVPLLDEIVSDSMFIWHNSDQNDSIGIVISYENKKDTFEYRKARGTFKDKKLMFSNPRQNRQTFHHTDSMFIEMNRPLLTIDTAQIILKDSSDTAVRFDSGIRGRFLWLTGSFKNNVSYTVLLYPDAMTDWFGNVLSDSLIVSCQTLDSEKFGSIKVTVSGIGDTVYLLDLMDKDKKIDTRILKNNDIIVFDKLKSSTYSINITEDLNNDGRWNSGRFMDRIKSERIEELQLESLKEGWELEVDVNVNELFNGTED